MSKLAWFVFRSLIIIFFLPATACGSEPSPQAVTPVGASSQSVELASTRSLTPVSTSTSTSTVIPSSSTPTLPVTPLSTPTEAPRETPVPTPGPTAQTQAQTERQVLETVVLGTNQGVSIFDGQSWTTYTTVDGLADNSVQAVAVDEDGHYWFGTSAGLSQFDGQRWTTYTAADGLASNQVRVLAVAGSEGSSVGPIWIGTQVGLSRFDSPSLQAEPEPQAAHGQDKVWTTYTTTNTGGLASNFVETLAIDEAGRRWFGFGEKGNGVTMFDGQQWTTYTTANGLSSDIVYAITADATGRLWFGTAAGITVFDGQTWTTYTAADGLANDEVRAIAVAPTGEVWLGTAEGISVLTLNAQGLAAGWVTYTPADGLKTGPVYAITIDKAGRVWVGSRAPQFDDDAAGGVSMFDGQTWVTYPSFDHSIGTPSVGGLFGNWVHDIALDADGNVWFATVAYAVSKPVWVDGGVSRLIPDENNSVDGQAWTNYTVDDGLVDREVNSLVIDDAGDKWFGTSGGLSRFDGQHWTTYTTEQGLAHNAVRDLAFDPLGHLWVATWGGGLSEFDGKSWTTYTTSGLADNQINTLALDPAGHLWVGTPGGLSTFDGQKWRAYTTADGLVDNRVNAIAVDPAGHIWAGTEGGVSQFDGQAWTSYTQADGLTTNAISALAIDATGQVWATSYFPHWPVGFSTNLDQFDGQRWSTVKVTELSYTYVYALVIDGQGYKWFGIDDVYNDRGLVKLDDQTVQVYAPADGLAGDQVYAIATGR